MSITFELLFLFSTAVSWLLFVWFLTDFRIHLWQVFTKWTPAFYTDTDDATMLPQDEWAMHVAATTPSVVSKVLLCDKCQSFHYAWILATALTTLTALTPLQGLALVPWGSFMGFLQFTILRKVMKL
jgi:hypothetical protein